MGQTKGSSGDEGTGLALHFAANRLLATLSPADRSLLEACATVVKAAKGEILFEAGDDLDFSLFPCGSTLAALVVDLENGTSVEVASIGREGAVGGIVSCGAAPTFCRAVVQIGGPALRIEMRALEAAKSRSSEIRDLFCRYSDALLAQVMQSVACNAAHPLQARFCRWLLISQDRVGGDRIPLTQSYLAEMLGVQRTSVSGVARHLQELGLIRWSRGLVEVRDRAALEECACECYDAVERHFRTVLPEVKPQLVRDAAGLPT